LVARLGGGGVRGVCVEVVGFSAGAGGGGAF